MNDIQSTLKFKNIKVETPNFYLGEKLKKKDLGGKEVWTMSSTAYIKSSANNVEEQLKKKGYQLPSRAVTPMSQGYYPETDLSPEVDQYGITIFQEFIGILRWAVKIVRVDILTDISMLSSVSKKRSHQTDTSHL